ncbi:MAG: arginyltransferase [Lysobacteraceae bacterium]
MRETGIRLFQTPEHACGYWPERRARDVLLDPSDPQLARLYPHMLAVGFRRSGDHVYRPRCHACRACVPLRIDVTRFRPSRNQRRCLARNADIGFLARPAQRNSERFGLYRRYLLARHPDGGMVEGGPDEFDRFLCASWSPTCFFELRQDARLLGIAVTDVLPDALSAVYTFFEPTETARSLGTLAILRQIQWARDHGKHHLYLGFWIDGHPKMHYKTGFDATEILTAQGWRPLCERG